MKVLQPLPLEEIGETFSWREFFYSLREGFNLVGSGAVYGGFYSTVTQTVSAANIATPVLFNSTLYLGNVGIGTPTSRIVHNITGTYRISVELQFSKANAATSKVNFWFRKNGVDIPNSGFVKTLSGNSVIDSAAMSLLVNVTAFDYIEVMFSSSDNQMSVVYTPITVTPVSPSSPSALFITGRIL